MEKKEALERLRLLEQSEDRESAHVEADKIILQFVDTDIAEAWEKIDKWFA